MTPSVPHLLIAPVVLPLIAAALLLLFTRQSWRLKSFINMSATLAGLLVAVAILLRVDSGGGSAAIGVYLASNWEAPFGIVLVADRLSALMLVLVGVVSFCSALYAEGGWSRGGVYFHPLFQIQLMGLNGAFLTGDLFNLFVFFEVMLAASYGLQLHGSGRPRVRSGLHYIVVNLLASSLFLVGLAVLYGVLGTLSMADIAEKVVTVPARDRGLLHAGAAILAAAFLIKAAIWPLNFWLVPTYNSASAPVAALFALMTKVGIYALIRLWTLLSVGPSAYLGAPVLLYGGLATLGFGVLGVLASVRLGRIAGFSIIVSSGTLLAALGVGAASVTSAALFYMPSATLAVSGLFLLVELFERVRSGVKSPMPELDMEPSADTNLDNEEVPLVGRAFPVSLALLGIAFMCSALLIAGLPPGSGFLAKVSLLRALLSAGGDPLTNSIVAPPAARWVFFGLLLVSGLAATISLSGAGIRCFWSASGRSAPNLKLVEVLAVLFLLLSSATLSVFAEPVLRYASATAADLHAPAEYIRKVLSTRPIQSGAGLVQEGTP